MKLLPVLDLHPVPDEGKLLERVEHVSGAAASLFFHLYHGNFYVGSMLWISDKKYWQVNCDFVQADDMYIIIRSLQAHILKYNPALYRDAGLPEDPEVSVLEADVR